ncbi:tripartite tricarboxylate transporter permease [Microbacterium azadirachtae]|jgi:putative tricarboxylic transport membrane protein|uniref:Tripartite tricarboxylate transporter TctA family protein n=1 Tax=Microbacterium azadirachtae TaxID=582680 RepID=A0A0F0KQW6_9MICO|nr:tripartite tricarboxylate transporter permease [Microbacterium azadirachtae]KJL23248.1 Tripartite tricarboxylate transporter TctA family protein [Microbacterium azadirachtae]UXW86694.1 tripartite tricarboxylate transporter permease [Microbacterium azadirachtae]SDM39888.1 putative tricarboxylic transport membrane protein [Microbacterium azadirachtae]SEG54856.1 putative tricarboxylic transport membrane protein [Microbacterium azadirachtae]SEG57753.1 putative tricarboxylic transport membrane p
MDSWNLLMEGFATALQPQYLVFAFLGVLLGTAVGVLPGIGPAMTVALLLPLTYTLEPAAALITFAGIYYGGMYGGSTTSILLNTPGESASIVTAIEGNKMAKLGRGAAALATAAIGSFVAGSIATLGLTLLAPVLARFAVNLGPADYVALIVIAFVTVGALLGSSVPRGMVSLGVGLFLGLIGTEVLSGQQRYTLGLLPLADGIDVVLVAVGLFAVGETLYVAARLRHGPIALIPVARGWRSWMSREDWKRSWKPWLRGTAIGFPIGTIPAGGADVATFLSYAAERKLSRHKGEFGRGAIEGVAGPEAANNAAAAGVLVPLLTLGLPTTATAAIIITAFQSYGIQPGPQLFSSQPGLVWALVASLYIGNVILLVLNLPLVGMWVKLLQIPRPYLYAGILLFACFGAYAVNFSVVDILILLIIGVLGFFMRRYGYPVAPLVVGMILGPMGEAQLRRALQLSQGDLTTLVMHPFAASAYGVLALLIAGGLWLKRRQRRYELALTESIAVPVSADREI